MQTFPNGTIFSVSNALAAAVAISAISNANPAVASSATPPTDDSIIVLTSGWPDANGRVFRTQGADLDSFELEGLDTTSLQRYPAGAGAGSFRKVSTWVTLSQVRDVAKSGGEQQFFQWQYVEDISRRQRQRPTYKNAKVLTLTLDYDPALAWYEALTQADNLGEPVVLRAVLPNGAELYYSVYPSFDDDPSMTLNENMTNVATFSLNSQLSRYEAA